MLTWLPSELVAFSLQTVLCGILGSVCAGASPIFQIDRWSLARQTITHFLLLSVTMITIASVCGWASPAGFSLLGTLSYADVFIVIYLIIWASMPLYWRNWVKKANSKLS
jgi:phage shock protein PspC (stress-responsive transcriptional regulator)